MYVGRVKRKIVDLQSQEGVEDEVPKLSHTYL